MIIIESGLLEEVRVSAAIEQFKRRNHDKFRGQQNSFLSSRDNQQYLDPTKSLFTKCSKYSNLT